MEENQQYFLADFLMFNKVHQYRIFSLVIAIGKDEALEKADKHYKEKMKPELNKYSGCLGIEILEAII